MAETLIKFKNPTLTVEETISLPVFSIIEVDSVLYEKTVTEKGQLITLVELDHTGSTDHHRYTGNEELLEGKSVLLLRVAD